MRKILLYLVLLLVGVGLGYALNSKSNNEDDDQKDINSIYTKKIKKHVVRDSNRTNKVLKPSPTVDSVFITDTVYISDTLSTDNEDITFSEENEEDIIMEEMIAQRSVLLGLSPNDSTDVSELLALKSNAFAKEIIVEFWQSPLNITGYELTRNRLKLFGFNPNESISLQLDKNEEQILLNTESMSLVLKKSKQFKTLKLK